MNKASKPENTLRFMLRSVWDRSFLKWDALRRTKQGPNAYKCEGCGKVFKLRDVHVDHINPVVDPEKGWEGVQKFVQRLFCPSSELQILCIDGCHAEKTKKENVERREAKRCAVIAKKTKDNTSQI